ncbi:putative glutathione-specific gamma-glutamylcyclotransferase 2 [Planococcus citri]|uniref:putative glutathione-specific gamma-glutamylcyclotransferase 2 n=1 Tax=Planococcus citri TaxID=170843 RepID=UPI0031F80A8D
MQWLFGYGSLIWKVDFPYKQKHVGYIEGFERRFYQYSTDHRGTEQNPGRVVTLLKSDDPQQRVWGVAYEIDDSENGAVWSRLDFREKNGYKRKVCTFHPKDETVRPFDVTVYIGDPDNQWYAGEAPVVEIARNIISGKGKSGFNLDYLRQLAQWMRRVVPEASDPHLFELEKNASRLLLLSSAADEMKNQKPPPPQPSASASASPTPPPPQPSSSHFT